VIVEELKLAICATPGTAEMLFEINVPCTTLEKRPNERRMPSTCSNAVISTR
jgi:hypothetical protein